MIGRVEHMRSIPNVDSCFWRILGANGLADLSQFHQSEFCDEVPLYSRESEVSFLEEVDCDRANTILLTFAWKFLNAVISYERHSEPYFVAITVWDFDSGRLIVPNLFVHSGKGLKSRLALETVKSPFGRKVKALLPRRGPSHEYELGEDRLSVEGNTRVLIGPAVAPYRAFQTVGALRAKPVAAAKGS